MPFSALETKAIRAQALRAVVDGNLKFGALENVKMILLYLLRTAALEIMPTGKVIGGSLLDATAKTTMATWKDILVGESVGLP